MAGLLAPLTVPSAFRGRDVIHFVDDTSALFGFIGGASSVSDSAAIFALFHILLARMGCRYWAEHVESEANVSDGVSRKRLADFLIKRSGCDTVAAVAPDFPSLISAPLESLRSWFDIVAEAE